MQVSVSVPAIATAYDYIYGSNTGTIQTPPVSLGMGTAGSAVTLAASGTIDIQVVATANVVPTATNVPSTITFSLEVASTSSTAFSQYTVVLTIG